jgi:hypothetical protein
MPAANFGLTKLKGFAAMFGIATAGLLAGCSMSDDTMASLMVAPGKFTLYSCEALVEQERKSSTRARELEQLMARAEVDASGRLVSTIAYRSEYLTVRGELEELRRAAAEKKCPNIPGEHTSDTIIR